MAKKQKSSLSTSKANSIAIDGYRELLNELKEKISKAQLKAVVAVNEELIRLHWDIGKAIVERHRKEKWGAKTVDNIGVDLQRSFPGMDFHALMSSI